MKKLAILVFAFMALNVSAQKYLDDIAKETCKCSENIKIEPGSEEFFMEFGLCMFEAAGPYKKKIKKELGIDLFGGEAEGEKLGQLIGARMAEHCPAFLLSMAANMEEMMEDEGDFAEEEYEEKEESELSFIEGEITDISLGQVVSFTITNDEGSDEYYLLAPIETDMNIEEEFESLKGKKVMVNAYKMDIFNGKTAKFETVNMLDSIYLDE